MKPQKLAIFFGLALLVVWGVEQFIGHYNQTSLLFSVTIFLGAAHGCVALVAAAELCQGQWAKPLKRHLLKAVPLILLCTLIYLFIIPQWKNLYPHAVTDGSSKWFTGVAFCVGRNVAVMLISFVLAALYAKHTLAGNEKTSSRFAVFYLFSFVICQTMVALDVVMPLEYPWFSTLLGASYFVEALYLGLVISTFISYAKFKGFGDKAIPADVKKAQYDVALITHGFSILWTYMFFSQLIAIWYGNIPEEILFFSVRTLEGTASDPHISKFLYIGIAAALFLFLIPFISLIFKRVKGNPVNMTFLGLLIIVGVLFEKTYIIGGVPIMDAHHETFSGRLHVNGFAVAIEFVLLASIYFLQFKTSFTEEEEARTEKVTVNSKVVAEKDAPKKEETKKDTSKKGKKNKKSKK